MHEPWWIAIIEAVIIINLVMVTFAYLTWTERKVMGRIQLRYGPNRAGPFGLLQPIADLVLPGTSYLEREGTYVNIEGRLQRLRRTAAPPGPDELEWIAQLAARFGVRLSPHAPAVCCTTTWAPDAISRSAVNESAAPGSASRVEVIDARPRAPSMSPSQART